MRHTGRSGDPVIGLVDGGPSSTLDRAIAPALEAHGITPQDGGLDWLCVSHVDSDHIGGVLSLVRRGYSVDRFLYNTPSPFPGQDVAPAAGPPGAGSTESELTKLVRPIEQDDVLPASYGQGQDLLDLVIARDLHLLNPPDNERLLTGATLDIDGLAVQVVAPSAGRIDALLAAWAAEVGSGVTPASSKTMDDSITNLSSLSLLLIDGDRKALFTGDQLEDDIVAGLKALGHQLPMHVDVLKVPHHGSNSAANPRIAGYGGRADRERHCRLLHRLRRRYVDQPEPGDARADRRNAGLVLHDHPSLADRLSFGDCERALSEHRCRAARPRQRLVGLDRRTGGRSYRHRSVVVVGQLRSDRIATTASSSSWTRTELPASIGTYFSSSRRV